MSAVGSEYTLNGGDIPIMTSILVRVSDVWEQLATALELPDHIITPCRNASFVLTVNDVFWQWITGNGVTPINLRTLKSKLECGEVGKKEFAKELITELNKESFGASTPEVAASVAGGK